MGHKGYFFSRLLWAAVALVTPLLVLSGYTLYRSHEIARQGAVRAVQSKALHAARQLDDLFDRSERLLAYVAAKTDAAASTTPRCGDFIRGLQGFTKHIANIEVVTLHGDVVCSSREGPAASTNVLESVWFRQALAGEGFVLSKPLVGGAARPLRVMLGTAVRDAAGRKHAVVGLALDLDAIGELVSWEGLQAGSSVSIIDNDATFVYRTPDSGTWVDQHSSALAQVQAVAGESGVYTAIGADGVERIFAFAATRHHRLNVVAGLPVALVFAESDRLMRQEATVAAAILLLAACVAYLTARSLARPMRSLVSTARVNAGGGAPVLADESLPGEFGSLAAEVNAMLKAYAHSEARAEASERTALRLARFYKALSDTNQAIARITRPQELFEAICGICVDTGQASMAWVGEVRDGQLVPVAWGGPARDYTDSVKTGFSTGDPSSVGPSMTAVLEGRTCVANDFLNDPRTWPWREAAAAFGVRSSIAVPFRRGGSSIAGTLNLYATEVGIFDDQLVDLLQGMAADISFALDHMRQAEAHERAVQQVARREAQLAGVIESVLNAIISIDASHRIVVFNQAAARTFGVPAAQALGQSLDRFIPVRYRAAHARHVDQFGADDSGARAMGPQRSLTGLRSDGTEFPIVASVSRVGHGDDVLMTVVLRDVTDEHEAERVRIAAAEAEASNRAKTDFLSRISHELRTPLNAVLGFTQLLQADARGRLSRRDQRHLDLVFLAGAQMRALLDDVLDVSRIESGNLSMVLQDVPLRGLLKGVLRMSEAAAHAAGVTLRLQHAVDGHLHLRTDPVRLRQVMLNLLSNAIKYNRSGGSVTVGVEPVQGVVRISVVDTGMGLSPEQLAALFQPFNRLGREQSGIAGTGLGMALVRQLVELLGGSVAVESQVGAGTTVRVELPMARVEPAPTGHESVEPAARPHPDTDPQVLPSGVVLYIEDNPVNVLLVEQVLKRWPAVQFVTAEDGRSGIAQALALQPDVVLLDMGLPDMSGMEVLKALCSHPATRDTCVIALSGSAMEQEVSAALAAGAQAYWTKPIDFGTFLEGLRGFLPTGTVPSRA